MSKRELLGTITEDHLHGRSPDHWRIRECIGRILPQDVGKQYFDMGHGVIQVENQEQFATRMAQKDLGTVLELHEKGLSRGIVLGPKAQAMAQATGFIAQWAGHNDTSGALKAFQALLPEAQALVRRAISQAIGDR